MFWKKKKVETKPEKLKGIQVIPEDFYGGKDPIVHFENVETKGGDKKKKKIKKEHKISKISASGGVSQFFKSKLFLYISIGVVSLLIIGAITWFYLDQAGFFPEKVRQAPVGDTVVEKPVEKVIEKLPVKEEIVEEIVAPTTTPVVEEEKIDIPTSLEEQRIDFPRIIQTDSVDLDADSLTDAEEEIFGTDSGAWDTDNDGYYDGQEVVNLYNPKGVAPVKLIDSGLIQEYINPKWQYRVYYPIGWERGLVDEEGRQVLLSSITGDFVEILVFDMKKGEEFINWFARKAEGQKYTDIYNFTNLFEEDTYKRRDGLVAYFMDNSRMYVLLYHPGVTGFIPYRHVMEMMINSFRPSKTLVEIPEQVIVPPAPEFGGVNSEVDVFEEISEDVSIF